MGERQPERTRYTLLPDPNDTKRMRAQRGNVHFSLSLFHYTLKYITQNKIFFNSRDRGQRGIKGVNVPWIYTHSLSQIVKIC
jgi:hypothetical protein